MTKKSIIDKIIDINNKSIVRPILGISDASRVVEAIVDNPVAGIYNIASFSDTVENISNTVSGLLLSNIQTNPDLAGVYDFVMNTNKFKTTYNFEFKDTVYSIVQEIIDNFDHTNFSNRNRFINYE